MKILLCCAGGLSSSVVMKKVRKYMEEKGEEVTIDAVGVSEVYEKAKNYDVVLTAPQVRNRFADIQKDAGDTPVAAMNPQDYAIGNAANIIKQVKSVIEK